MKACTRLILVLLPLTFCVSADTSSKNSIILDDHYNYIIIGSDHVAKSAGLHMAKSNQSKKMLVLQTSQCIQILESELEPDMLGLDIANKFAEGAHRSGYPFVDSLFPGRRVGVAYKNQTRRLRSTHQTLLAVDPNLKLLTGAAVVRLLYNNVASAVLGVEVELHGSRQYIYVEDEVIITGRCLNDYKHVAAASIVSEATLATIFKGMSLEIALGSPVLAPILYVNAGAPLQQNPTLLGTELFLRSPESQEEDKLKPNVRLRMIMGNANLENHVWFGFAPSLLLDDQSSEPSHDESVRILSYAVKVAAVLAEFDELKELQLTSLDQRIPECLKYLGTVQYWTCYVDTKVKQFEKKALVSHFNTTLLDRDFHLNGVKALRLVPFGLTTPFLTKQWDKMFPLVEQPFDAVTLQAEYVTEGVNALEELFEVLKKISSGTLHRGKSDV